MGDVAIRVEGLGKQYHLGGRPAATSLREQLGGLRPSSLRGLLRRAKRAESRPTFWALKDVGFEVKRGEVVGIIGRNGAGKSTLLKILSRITEPTEGGVDIHGRVGSLLEVGTGFHHELTGRENIFLNGAILGMKRAEIARKFGEIVAFAEVEKFIDTAVKYYSSGMYVRLAFAVAAHLEPEVLIVDEVLAVGDAAFQKRCLGRMGEVSREGRTVLFVSHSMQAVRILCARSVVLAGGRVEFDGPTPKAILDYLSTPEAEELIPVWDDRRTGVTGDARLSRVRVTGEDGTPRGSVAAGIPFNIEIEYKILRRISCQIAFRINRVTDGETVFTTGDGDREYVAFRERSPGGYRSRVRIPGHLLAPGRYTILLAANRPNAVHPIDVVDNVVLFEIDQTGSLSGLDRRLGTVMPLLEWTEDRPNDAAPAGI